MPPIEKPAPDSIADDLRAAFTAADTPDAAGAAPEAPHGGETPEAPGATETPEAGPAQAGTRPRAPDGKFARMGEPIPGREPREKLTLKTDAPAATPGAPVAAQPAATAGPTPPPGWSVPSKASFKELPPHVQADIAKREQDVAKGFENYRAREAAYKEIAATLEPRMGELRSNGRTVGQSLQMLFAAGDLLAKDTPAALVHIANNAGISLAELAAMQGGGGNAPQNGTVSPQMDPTIAALARQVQNLTGYITQAERASAEEQRTAADSEIASFASTPDHVYFENVRGEMARLLQGGFANDLPQAYQMACSMHPEIRDALLQERVKSEIARTQKEQAARAASARRANGSLTGAPSPGSVGVTAPKDSLRSELTEAFRASRA